MRTPHRSMRTLAGALAATVALAAAPLTGTASAADELPPPADPLGFGAFCDGAPADNPFDDLGAESTDTRRVIICLVAAGLTRGKTDTTYAPGDPVSRRQMALFVKRLAELLERNETGNLPKLPAYDGTPDYPDVAEEQPEAEAAIGQLTQAGIVGGFADGAFRPGADVSRRQMAAFIIGLWDFLGNAPQATGDYFDDDDGDTGEANLNRLAEVGIFQGGGNGRVFPGEDISRRQMANVLLRTGQVFLEAGAISPPFGGDNQDFSVSPDTEGRFDHGETRGFTASDLDGDVAYDIAIFACSNVQIDGDGTVTFTAQGETAPDDAKADAGSPAATITRVNGVDTTSGDGIDPAGTTITFIITSEETECVRPVVFADPDDDDTLDLSSTTKQPVDAFGVGGATQFTPEEAADGFPVNGSVVLAGPGYAVVDSGLSASTVFFRNGDVFVIDDEVVDSGVFFQALSTGDGLSTCDPDAPLPIPPATYSQDGDNTFCLDDSAPDNPTELTAAAGAPASSSVALDWTAADPADAYNVYRNPENCTNTTVGELGDPVATVAASKTTYTDTGLSPATNYCYVVTTVEEGDESEVAVGSGTAGNDNTVAIRTQGVSEPPTITSAALTTDVDTGAVGTGDVITLVFSEAMDPTTVNGATFSVIDQASNDTTTITCGASPTPDDGVTAATCELDAGSNATVDNDTLVLTLGETGDDANAAGGGSLDYPLTITASTVLTDADDNRTVDVAGSADKTIS